MCEIVGNVLGIYLNPFRKCIHDSFNNHEVEILVYNKNELY